MVSIIAVVAIFSTFPLCNYVRSLYFIDLSVYSRLPSLNKAYPLSDLLWIFIRHLMLLRFYSFLLSLKYSWFDDFSKFFAKYLFQFLCLIICSATQFKAITLSLFLMLKGKASVIPLTVHKGHFSETLEHSGGELLEPLVTLILGSIKNLLQLPQADAPGTRQGHYPHTHSKAWGFRSGKESLVLAQRDRI